MFVYAEDMMQDDCLNCITMEECKSEPWRWRFVQISPGQEEDPEVIEYFKKINKSAKVEEDKPTKKVVAKR